MFNWKKKKNKQTTTYWEKKQLNEKWKGETYVKIEN